MRVACGEGSQQTKTAVCLSVCLDNGTDQSKFGELITKQPSPGVLLFWFYRYTALNQHQQHEHGGKRAYRFWVSLLGEEPSPLAPLVCSARCDDVGCC